MYATVHGRSILVHSHPLSFEVHLVHDDFKLTVHEDSHLVHNWFLHYCLISLECCDFSLDSLLYSEKKKVNVRYEYMKSVLKCPHILRKQFVCAHPRNNKNL